MKLRVVLSGDRSLPVIFPKPRRVPDGGGFGIGGSRICCDFRYAKKSITGRAGVADTFRLPAFDEAGQVAE